jgi:hypothetical protein
VRARFGGGAAAARPYFLLQILPLLADHPTLHLHLHTNPPLTPTTPSHPLDLSELDLPKGVTTRFPGGADAIMAFEVVLRPDEGLYAGGAFLFSFAVPASYPHDPPKVKCLTRVFHPNIDLEGNVCLNVLREDWKPVLTVRCWGVGVLGCGLG